MGDEQEPGGKHSRRRTDRSPHERIDELEEDIASLRERVASMEQATKALGRSIDLLRTDMGGFRDQIGADIRGLRDGILTTFSRMFVSLVFVIVIAFGVVSAIVGGSVYIEGFGLKGGTGQQVAPVAQ